MHVIIIFLILGVASKGRQSEILRELQTWHFGWLLDGQSR